MNQLPLVIAAQTQFDPDVLPKGREYFELHDGIANAQLKFQHEKTGRIAFLGGSIPASKRSRPASPPITTRKPPARRGESSICC